MSEYKRPAYYWTRFKEEGQRRVPPGEELAALRRGIGVAPLEAPSMWSYYRTLNAEGTISRRLRAEHLALSLFGTHQQSMTRLMHWEGVHVAEALGVLRNSGKFSEAAVDRRVNQAVMATSLEAMSVHLRSLVGMLKSLSVPQGFDYSQLVDELTALQDPQKVGKVRRAWGMHYFRNRPEQEIKS